MIGSASSTSNADTRATFAALVACALSAPSIERDLVTAKYFIRDADSADKIARHERDLERARLAAFDVSASLHGPRGERWERLLTLYHELAAQPAEWHRSQRVRQELYALATEAT